jgi:hypothetical protein
MRNLCDVIDQIVPCLRDSETKVIADLERIKNSVTFAAPEMIRYWWQKAQDILVENIDSNHPNYKEILRIWNDK